jgi:hypothetical protein
VSITCSEACLATARLITPRVGRASSIARRLTSAGRTRFTVRPSRSALKRWTRIRTIRLELTFRDPANNARKVVKRVRLLR